MTTTIKQHVRTGGWALLGTQEASNDASLTQTGLSSIYDTYVVGMSNIVPASDSQQLNIRFGDSSGIDTGGSDYTYIFQTYQEGSTTVQIQTGSNGGNTNISQAGGNQSEEGTSAMMWILNPGDAGVYNTGYGYYIQYNANPELKGGHFYVMREAALVLDRVQLLVGSGNITSGRMTVWGIAHE